MRDIFKNKRYWILILPTILIGMMILMYEPPYYQLYICLLLVGFWLIYYTWNHYSKQSKEQKDKK